MPSLAPLENAPQIHSVKSVLTELLGIYQQQNEIRENLQARGIPVATVNMLRTLLAGNSQLEYNELCETAVRIAAEKHGSSAVSLEQLKNDISSLCELDEDAVYVRKIAKGMEMNAQALSMLTNIIRQNPGDSGKKVLTELMQYAAEYGVRVEGLRVVEGGIAKPSSVLPNIVIPQKENQGWRKYRNIAVELTVAAIATYAALSLVT